MTDDHATPTAPSIPEGGEQVSLPGPPGGGSSPKPSAEPVSRSWKTFNAGISLGLSIGFLLLIVLGLVIWFVVLPRYRGIKGDLQTYREKAEEYGRWINQDLQERAPAFDEAWGSAGTTAQGAYVLAMFRPMPWDNSEYREVWMDRYVTLRSQWWGEIEANLPEDARIDSLEENPEYPQNYAAASEFCKLGLWTETLGRGAVGPFRGTLELDAEDAFLQGKNYYAQHPVINDHLGYKHYTVPEPVLRWASETGTDIGVLTQFHDRWITPEQYTRMIERQAAVEAQIPEGYGQSDDGDNPDGE